MSNINDTAIGMAQQIVYVGPDTVSINGHVTFMYRQKKNKDEASVELKDCQDTFTVEKKKKT